MEKLAQRLVSALDYVQYSETSAKNASLVYFVPYRTFIADAAPIQIAYCTHVESDIELRELFWTAARTVDYCVSQSRRYADLLVNNGISNVVVISPGVDIDLFKPLIRIGIVGRRYPSGRKGEALLSAVIGLPGIQWAFAGYGWLSKPTFIPDELMPRFYNGVDYILVPSLYEGGPMCVIEALACGKEVIAPDVGWVNEFPHIPYKVGDVESLRGVLGNLLQKRAELRAHVTSRTWAGWIEGHDRLFRHLLEGSRLLRQAGRSSC